jgi:hypothetical protein
MVFLCLACLADPPCFQSKEKPDGTFDDPRTPAGINVGQPAQPQVSMPDAQKIVLLLRTTLLTLNDDAMAEVSLQRAGMKSRILVACVRIATSPAKFAPPTDFAVCEAGPLGMLGHKV